MICHSWWSIAVSQHPQMGPPSCRKTSAGLPLILYYGELYNYFIIYYNVIIIEIKCIINVMCLNHPRSSPNNPGLWKNCLPWNWFLVPKTLGTIGLCDYWVGFNSMRDHDCLDHSYFCCAWHIFVKWINKYIINECHGLPVWPLANFVISFIYNCFIYIYETYILIYILNIHVYASSFMAWGW